MTSIFLTDWRWWRRREWVSRLTKNSGAEMWNWRAAVFWWRANVKKGVSQSARERDQKGHWGKAEPEYNEWIYENGKFTEISATYWSMQDRHVFLKGWWYRRRNPPRKSYFVYPFCLPIHYEYKAGSTCIIIGRPSCPDWQLTERTFIVSRDVVRRKKFCRKIMQIGADCTINAVERICLHSGNQIYSTKILT